MKLYYGCCILRILCDIILKLIKSKTDANGITLNVNIVNMCFWSLTKGCVLRNINM